MGAGEQREGVVAGELGVEELALLGVDEVDDLLLQRLLEGLAEDDLAGGVLGQAGVAVPDGQLREPRRGRGIASRCRPLDAVHELDELHHPVPEDGLQPDGQEGCHLPVHDGLQILLVLLDYLLAGLAAVVELVVPHEVVPVLLDLEVDKVEERLLLDALEDVLRVGIRVSDLGLGCLQE